MHAPQALAAQPPVFTPAPQNSSTSRLSGAYVRNSPASDCRWSPQACGPTPGADSSNACMAYVSFRVAIANGGTASLWKMEGAHTFTVIGIPMGTHHSTIDFSEPEYRNAWVVDPWADISCAASEYMEKLKDQMARWKADGRQILATDWKANPPALRWMAPTDKAWTDKVIDGPKTSIVKKSR